MYSPMLKKIFALIGLTLSISANAASVSYNGYTLDTDTNIVTDGELEWLQWDETVGLTRYQAQLAYGGDATGIYDWRVASNLEMASLFNAFNFGITFDTDENTEQEAFMDSPEYSEDTPHNMFIDLFGDTYAAAGYTFDYGDKVEQSQAIFGQDIDDDNEYNRAKVTDEYTSPTGELIWSRALLDADTFPWNAAQNTLGVALVRNIDTQVVPVPAAAWLFGSALLGLGVIRRRKA